MSQLLQYRGYYGSAEANQQDDCLFGQVQFIRSLISYEGRTVAELVQAFHEAIDDYLADCKADGHEPEQTCKGSFNVRVGHELHLAASIAATRSKITLNDLMRRALSEYITRHA